MTNSSSADRERQRFEHLVLGRDRPTPATAAPKRRKGRVRASLRVVQPVRLADGVEERVALRERWSHKQGTAETLEHFDQAEKRPGSLARLVATGVIDRDQLAAAQQIAEAFRAIAADVEVRTASLETRVDGSRHGRAEEQAIGRVHSDLAYTWWRGEVGRLGDMLLSVIVHDVGLTIAARRAGMGMPRARLVLAGALDLWRIGRRATARRAAAIAG